MDSRVQRAILLKALMEVLHKAQGVELAEFQRNKEKGLQGPFTRFNSTPHNLMLGLEPYLTTVREHFDMYPDALPSDPIWRLVQSFVYGDGGDASRAMAVPSPLALLSSWNQLKNRPHLLKEMGGSWFLFRLSTDAKLEDPRIAVSLLNIKTQEFYNQRPGPLGQAEPWTEFALFLHQETAHDPTARIDGICFQYNTLLHFMGLLDKDATPVPTALALHYEPGSARTPKRRFRTDGMLFGANSRGLQISAPVFGEFIKESDSWSGTTYRDERAKFESRLGTHAYHEIEDIFPRSRFEELLQAHRDHYVFQAR